MTDTPASASAPSRNAPRLQGALLDQFRAETAGRDLWVFGYASLLWRPEFDAQAQHITRVWGWHRALKMWSRLNRGSPECPGLVFALLPGGSCQGASMSGIWPTPLQPCQRPHASQGSGQLGSCFSPQYRGPQPVDPHGSFCPHAV